jgi:hypothetical protein
MRSIIVPLELTVRLLKDAKGISIARVCLVFEF